MNRVLECTRDSGKLDNTVVIITAGRGIPLSEDEETFDWSHGHLQVPLVIHWPGTPAQRINALTGSYRSDDDADATPATCQHACSESWQGQDLFNPTPDAVITGLPQRITIRWQLPPRKRRWY
ncbi:sulfatase-like hydrolase/transferase [Escherichia coli]